MSLHSLEIKHPLPGEGAATDDGPLEFDEDGMGLFENKQDADDKVEGGHPTVPITPVEGVNSDVEKISPIITYDKGTNVYLYN